MRTTLVTARRNSCLHSPTSADKRGRVRQLQAPHPSVNIPTEYLYLVKSLYRGLYGRKVLHCAMVDQAEIEDGT